MFIIAILATGDELVNGDILNTNGKIIAQKLIQSGFIVNYHIVVSDKQIDIEQALAFLIPQSDAIIITGGLGPTSDDRTRFAASEITKLPLVFNEEVWQAIVTRIKQFSLQVHDSNRQQALFPEGSTIYPNNNGTAAGFAMEFQNTLLFFLPGPPNECLPLFDSSVLKKLLSHNKMDKMLHKQWRLFSVNESEIAAQLDSALNNYLIETGYRYEYPYLEFKIRSIDPRVLDQVSPIVESIIKPYLLSHHSIKASDYLIEQLAKTNDEIIIDDIATGGLLEFTLSTIITKSKIKFSSTNTDPQQLVIHIRGLDEFWNNQKEPGTTSLTIDYYKGNSTIHHEYKIPYRLERVRLYAVEFIADKVYQFLVSNQ